MDSTQVIKIINKYTHTLTSLGYIPNKETAVLLYIMFMDEYYEMLREDETLNDCIVKQLNNKLLCLKEHSCLFKGINFNYLYSIVHYIIPDAVYPKN